MSNASVVELVRVNIRAICALKNMQPAELARRIGMNQSALSTRWTGAKEWDISDIDKVASALEVHPADLMQPILNIEWQPVPVKAGNSKLKKLLPRLDSNQQPAD